MISFLALSLMLYGFKYHFQSNKDFVMGITCRSPQYLYNKKYSLLHQIQYLFHTFTYALYMFGVNAPVLHSANLTLDSEVSTQLLLKLFTEHDVSIPWNYVDYKLSLLLASHYCNQQTNQSTWFGKAN